MYTADRDIKRAAVVKAAGYPVTTIKLQCSVRCAFEYPNTIEVRQLLDTYELRQPIQVPPKSVLQAYTALLVECKELRQGAL